MIDFAKFKPLNLTAKNLLDNPRLEFKMDYNEKTGELSTDKKTAFYKGLKFEILYEKHIIISGSLHKFKNNGEHNYDRFYFSDLVKVLMELKNDFGIELEDSKIQNLEFGVNIRLENYQTNDILTNLMHHRNGKFQDPPIKNGNYRQVVHQRYYVKSYDKALQFNLRHYLLRFELKYVRMIDLNEIGVVSLSDLCSREKLLLLKNKLLNEWDEVFLYDFTIQEETLSNYIVNKKLNQWRNLNYWIDLNRDQKAQQIKKYNEIVKSNSKQIHSIIKSKINSEFLLLINEN